MILLISFQWGYTGRHLIRITWDNSTTVETSNGDSSEDEGDKKMKHLDKSLKMRKNSYTCKFSTSFQPTSRHLNQTL